MALWKMVRRIGVIFGWLEPNTPYEVIARDSATASSLLQEGKVEQARNQVHSVLNYCAARYDELITDDEEFQTTYWAVDVYFELLESTDDSIEDGYYDIILRIGEHFIDHRQEFDANLDEMSKKELSQYFRRIFADT